MSEGPGKYSPPTKCRVKYFDNIYSSGHCFGLTSKCLEHYGSHGSFSNCFPFLLLAAPTSSISSLDISFFRGQ